MSNAVTAPTLFVTVGGDEIAYREVGSGEPILLLQRFRCTLDHWDPGFVDRLADHRRVIMFDAPGVGGSQGEPRSSVSAMADAAAAVAAALGLDQADVLGWSMGGFVGQVLAIRHPQLVRRLVLVGTCPPGNPRLQLASDEWNAAALKPDYEFEDIVTLFFRQSPASRAAAEASEARMAQRIDRVPEVGPDGINAMVTAGMEYWADGEGFFDRLGEIATPVLIGGADEDGAFPLINQVVLAESIPNSIVAIYPDSGHGFHMQYVDEFCSAVENFLDSSLEE